jgi:hypothetical protein
MAVSIPLQGLAETGGGQGYPYGDMAGMDITAWDGAKPAPNMTSS